jgi:hypothetical protein
VQFHSTVAMIEVCPRCYSRLGAPLKSGRQVCANCGWSNELVTDKTSSGYTKRSSVRELVNIVGRIVRRAIAYVSQVLRSWIPGSKSERSAERPVGQRLVSGLSKRLSALEQAIPDASGEQVRWMSIEEAFRYLGGNPKDTNSTVNNLNGSLSIPFRRFQLLKTAAEFRAFGLEIDPMRQAANKPWLRWSDEA